jgi:uncharacterized protein (TIGR02246 family)
MTHDSEILVNRVQALEDRDAIRTLKARYLRACDLKQPDLLRETLAPEGAIIAYDGFPPFDNREAFIAVFEQMGCQPGIHDIHHATNSDIAFLGPDTASGKWSLNFQSINVGARTVTQMGVEYDDVYRREDGRWWIAETRTTRTSCLIYQIDTDGRATVVALGEPPAIYGEAG